MRDSVGEAEGRAKSKISSGANLASNSNSGKILRFFTAVELYSTFVTTVKDESQKQLVVDDFVETFKNESQLPIRY
jgi:hypothetical protein